jgi:uncharacterized protein YecT (DUF1311 family)
MYLFLAAALIEPAAPGPESCDGSQSELNVCAADFYKRADQELNVQWQKTVAVLRHNDKELSKWPSYGGASVDTLLKAQRAWLVYREQSCQTISRISGGTIAPMNYFVCMFDMTRTRTAELKALTLNPNSDEPL